MSALYFTVTVFSTVGFGDITPVTDPAWVEVGPDAVDLIFIVVVVRLIRNVQATSAHRSVRSDSRNWPSSSADRRHATGDDECSIEPSAALVLIRRSKQQRLAILLAMAMFVLVVDTSLMNVSISSVVHDLDTTVERGPVRDRPRGAGVGGVHPHRQQGRRPDRAQAGLRPRPARLCDRRAGHGARTEPDRRSSSSGRSSAASAPSLLLPAMQSLIHGNFEGAAQKKAYALVGASAAIAAAVGPLLGGFITTYLSWRVGFPLEARDHRRRPIRHQAGSRRALHRRPAHRRGRRRALGARHGRHRAQHPGVAGGRRGCRRCSLVRRRSRARPAFVSGWCRRKRRGKPTLIDPDLFKSKVFRLRDHRTDAPTDRVRRHDDRAPDLPADGARVQRNAGRTFARSAVADDVRDCARSPDGKPGHGDQEASSAWASLWTWPASCCCFPSCPGRAPGWYLVVPLMIARVRARAPGLAAEQLHARADIRRAGERSCRRELRGGIVRTLVRACIRRRHHAGDAVVHLHQHGGIEHCASAGRTAAGRARRSITTRRS